MATNIEDGSQQEEQWLDDQEVEIGNRRLIDTTHLASESRFKREHQINSQQNMRLYL